MLGTPEESGDSRTTEVLVYGGTAGGVAAAIAAARAGCDVLLVESGAHIGGMMASGLGAIDLLRFNAVGGIFGEFLDKVRHFYDGTYGESSEQYRLTWGGVFMEPHVAEIILEQMVEAESLVRVLKRTPLVGALLEEQRLLGARFRDGDRPLEVRAQVAIDATYEGDLAAAAGAAYRVGREGRSDHNESLAGNLFFDWRFNRQEILPQSTGESSGYVQAYCFRETLTDDPARRLPPDKPEGYADFLPMYRSLYKDLEIGRVRKLRDIIWIDPIPNRKWCTNGHIEALTSLNISEWNQAWPDANRHAREELEGRFRQYSQGLWYFLQHDPGLPRGIRTEAQSFGLCPDEYPDEGHYPWQLYIREGRRIVGEYVITQHDSVPEPGRKRPRGQRDSIGVYEHSFDSHPCRSRGGAGSTWTDDGFEVLEGAIWYRNKLESLNRPASVPYGAIVPEKIDGLLVPVALSATHVAYSAVRMEPLFMATGQAGGTAAALAIAEAVPPRRIQVDQLQERLVRAGQVLVYFDDLSLHHPDFAEIQLAAVGRDLPDFQLSTLTNS